MSFLVGGIGGGGGGRSGGFGVGCWGKVIFKSNLTSVDVKLG